VIRCVSLVAIVMGVAVFVSPAEAATLKIGDEAPPLKVAGWLKGESFDHTRGGKDTLYVVEFWATWCRPCVANIPHLSEIQRHFKSRVKIVGISDEERPVVESFVRAWDKKIDYAIAVDEAGATNEAYMEAVDARGIPYAFLVRGGRILWHGHPADMDEQIIKLTGDKEWAKVVEKIRERKQKQMEIIAKLNNAFEKQKWDEALTVINQWIALEPDDHMAALQKYYILAIQKEDRAAATGVGQKMLESIEDPDFLNEAAWTLLTDRAFEAHRDRKLALAMAEKANRLSEGKDFSVLDTLALAMFDTGDVDEAIRLQEQAVVMCKEMSIREDLENTLARYRSARP
jgi:thiol-disulfide isomerase/thioredoxin